MRAFSSVEGDCIHCYVSVALFLGGLKDGGLGRGWCSWSRHNSWSEFPPFLLLFLIFILHGQTVRQAGRQAEDPIWRSHHCRCCYTAIPVQTFIGTYKEYVKYSCSIFGPSHPGLGSLRGNLISLGPSLEIIR